MTKVPNGPVLNNAHKKSQSVITPLKHSTLKKSNSKVVLSDFHSNVGKNALSPAK